MKHVIFDSSQSTRFPVAILIKASAMNKQEMQRHYVDQLEKQGISRSQVIGFSLLYGAKKAPPVSDIKDYLGKLLKALQGLGSTHLYVTDSAYFKVLTGARKAEPHLGYAMPCIIKGFEQFTVVLGFNYQQLIYKPELKEKLDNTLDALASSLQGSYVDPGKGIIHSAYYPKTLQDIEAVLESLHQYPHLSCDIEAFSLDFNKAGIGTITFCWDQHNGIAFACDYYAEFLGNGYQVSAGVNKPNKEVRALLKRFFETYQGKLRFHRATYDVKCLIYALWMKQGGDTEGLLQGLEVMTRSIDDTLLITYLATNSTAGNQLGLKYLAQEFAGNYAVEVTDISKVNLKDLLEYNLVDGLCTNYVYDKYHPIMVRDDQLELYEGLFKDSLKLIIQLELTGMPMSRKRIQEVKHELESMLDAAKQTIHNGSIIPVITSLLQEKAWNIDYETRRDKAKNPDKIKKKELTAFEHVEFNPNSNQHLQLLFYEYMGLPIIDLTDSKAPAVGADTIEKLINHTQEPEHKKLLQALIDYNKITKILGTFIPAFENATPDPHDPDIVWLQGCFNLGGTVSGRLSSSDPNLQQIPSNSRFGKLIKSCFVAPNSWIFAGADFNALEDRVNALLTKDPNKLKVFTDGYDSHCLRAFYFFPDQLPGIIDDVHSINSIKDVFPSVRQAAKSPAFALQYAGTWRTLVKNLGFSTELAQNIETNFGKMYKVSAEWVAEKVKDASKKGYSTTAFGLRIRTPLLKQVILGTDKTPYEAEAEARTLGNAISGQAYGLLNNRALVAFMKKVWASPYRTQILPVAMIHDASYLVMADNIEVVTWVNEHLTKEMKWQELPELQHPKVMLGAELDLFYKGWHQPITLRNNMTPEAIIEHVTKEKLMYDKKV